MEQDACYDNCTDFNTTIVEHIDVGGSDESIKICTVIDSVGCTITFRYSYWDEDTLKVEALKEKVSCPEPIDILGETFLCFDHNTF